MPWGTAGFQAVPRLCTGCPCRVVGTQAVSRSQGARGHGEGSQAVSRPGAAVAGLSTAVPCPADGADDRQHAGPRHGHQDEEPALAHHGHSPRHDRWVPAMGRPARRVGWGRRVGAPRVSPALQQRPPPAPRAAPLPAPRAAAGINYASAARGGRSHVLGRAPVTLRDPWHCHPVPGAPAGNPPHVQSGGPHCTH